MRRKEGLFFVLILIGLLLLSNTYLGYSFGDSVFRAVGLPPWTDAEYDSGLHLSVLAGLLVLVVGYLGAVRFYQARFPKIRSRIILSGIAFVFLFPIVTEQAIMVLHYNSVSVSSVAFSRKTSQCTYRSEAARVQADCSLTLINSGKAKEATVRLYLLRSASEVRFEPVMIMLPPHRKIRMGMTFTGRAPDGASFGGWANDVGIEVEVDGLTKRYGKAE